MTQKKFKTIGIIGRVRNPGVKETLQTLINYLIGLKQKFYVEQETAEAIPEVHNLSLLSRDQLGVKCDLVIVVGGDGSLLHAAHALVNHETAILGINRGSLGFLTDIHPTELEKIQAILDGNYTLEKRFLLSTSIEFHQQNIGHGDALNEVALIPDAIPHMLEFEIYVDHQFVCSQNSDGFIIATPTGSTAYALSAGGPILHPQLDAIVLVPMFPHALTGRPIVIDGNSTIEIVISPNNLTSPRVSCDGQTYITIPPGSHIKVCKKPERLNLIHPVDYHYYETLRSKLHWGTKLQYSE